MKACVTGCAGFIGSHLAERLLEMGFKVTGIDCFSDYYPRRIKEINISRALNYSNFKIIKRDITDMSAFPEVDYIFHLAAQPGVRASWSKFFKIYVKNNIESTQKLLEFYKNKKILKFVYASSSSVYGDTETPMREDSTPRPISPYGVTKLAAENLCNSYQKNYRIPAISLRYFTVYGPRQRPDMAVYRFIENILRGKEIIVYGDGNHKRDLIFVSDVIEATIVAAQSDLIGEVFNVGSGCNTSINELISIIGKINDKGTNVRYFESQKGDVKETLADISKIKELMDWRPKIDVAEGLRRQIEWMKSMYQ
jgi:UDP-glucose 4-epimerase